MNKVNPYKYESSLNDTFILSLESELNSSDVYFDTLSDCFEFILELIMMQTHKVREVSLLKTNHDIFFPVFNLDDITSQGLDEMAIKPKFITQAKKL